jgi:hypothetical protein
VPDPEYNVAAQTDATQVDFMTPEAYREFTRQLVDELERDERVLGLVALGSMAAIDYEPDQWSDHDFFVITRPGDQAAMRASTAWLPSSERLVLHFAETDHGVKALWDDGHLVEFAVFDEREVRLAKVNRYRVLLDRGDVARIMSEVHVAAPQPPDARERSDRWRAAQFLTNVLVGVGRDRRGERLSGHYFVKSHALSHLLVLLARHVPAERRELLDDLDPARRFDLVYPELAAELHAALVEEVPAAASRLVALASRELAPRLADYPVAASAVVEREINRR